jgi:hypothetical protein
MSRATRAHRRERACREDLKRVPKAMGRFVEQRLCELGPSFHQFMDTVCLQVPQNRRR